MRDFGNRHGGVLDGRLHESFDITPVSVLIRLSEEHGHSAAVQHTAWMTCNLLCRLKGVVSEIVIDPCGRAPLLDRVIPAGENGAGFSTQLIERINDFGLIQAYEGDAAKAAIFIGPGKEPGLRAVGDGWIGGLTRKGLRFTPSSTLPFGPYLAACYVVAEIFREARLKIYEPTVDAFYDTWTFCPSEHFHSEGPESSIGSLSSTLAGAGAVGNAWLHTMWAIPELQLHCIVADPDPKGVEDTNLNRYCLFGASHVGKRKASASAVLLCDKNFRLEAFDGTFEQLTQKRDIVICAVDENEAREGVQSSYQPIMLMASTSDLRAEVLRCVDPGVKACLRCYNPPVPRETDEQSRARMQALSSAEQAILAERAGISLTATREYIYQNKCGEASERLLRQMRVGDNESNHGFSVSFVSVTAGVLLAAETCKLILGTAEPLNADFNRATIQFVSPWKNLPADSVGRDPKCPACAAGPALDIWRKRFEAHLLNQTLFKDK